MTGGMDTHRNNNDSGWTDQSSIPNCFSTKWFEAQINVWARRIDLSLRRIFELGSHWAPAPVAVAAASLLEERGWAGPGLRRVSCHVEVSNEESDETKNPAECWDMQWIDRFGRVGELADEMLPRVKQEAIVALSASQTSEARRVR